MTLFPKSNRRAERRSRKHQQADADRLVYESVDLRDGFKCQGCGRTLTMDGDLITNGHRHHIRFRSLGGLTTSDNVVMVCAGCHYNIHDHKLKVTGNADHKLKFEWLP